MRGGVVISLSLQLALAASVDAQGVVVDNGDGDGFAILSGSWFASTAAPGYQGANYLACLTTGAGGAPAEVEWRPNLPGAGSYQVFVNYVAGANRADNASFTVHHRDGSTNVLINQQATGSQWVPLGTFAFAGGTTGYVRLSNSANPSYVCADAVRFLDEATVQTIPASDPRLGLEGTFFATPGSPLLQRFSDGILTTPSPTFAADRARTASGIVLRVRTDSPWLKAAFSRQEGYWAAGQVTIYQDGVADAVGGPLEVSTTSQNPGRPVTYRILCPPYESLAFTGLEIEAGASLYPLLPECRPRYLAVGDSITHGSGMPRGDQPYAWLLAEAKGWELFNLGVGGSRVTPSFGSMLDAEPLDVVTVLWGQNDFVAYNDVPLFVSRYEEFLTNLRRFHPKTALYCITLTATTGVETGSKGYTREQYRQGLRDLVAARRAAGDPNIHLLEGPELSTTADLRDEVHLSANGNVNVAARLAATLHCPGPSGVFFDFDRDCDIDQLDLATLTACLSGPGLPMHSGCEDKDFTGDGSVDQSDFGLLQRCLTDVGQAIDRGCAD